MKSLMIQYVDEKISETKIKERKIKNTKIVKQDNGYYARKGTFVATVIEDKIAIGWCFCNYLDNFDRKRGTEIALARAEKMMKNPSKKLSFNRLKEVENTYKKELEKFLNRVQKFFKDKEICRKDELMELIKE